MQRKKDLEEIKYLVLEYLKNKSEVVTPSFLDGCNGTFILSKLNKYKKFKISELLTIFNIQRLVDEQLLSPSVADSLEELYLTYIYNNRKIQDMLFRESSRGFNLSPVEVEFLNNLQIQNEKIKRELLTYRVVIADFDYFFEREDDIETYKRYLVDTYFFEEDNTPEKKSQRANIVESLGNDFFENVINDTKTFVICLLEKMINKNVTYMKDYYSYTKNIDTALSHEYHADKLFVFEDGLVISEYLLKKYLKGFTITEEYEVEDHIDEDIYSCDEYNTIEFHTTTESLMKAYERIVKKSSKIQYHN